jgi:hypothetical protein
MSETNSTPADNAAQNTQHTITDTQDQAHKYSFGRLLITLSALAFTLFVSFIDQTSVSTALPAIAKSLNAFDSISWAGTSFLVANASFQLINGRIR